MTLFTETQQCEEVYFIQSIWTGVTKKTRDIFGYAVGLSALEVLVRDMRRMIHMYITSCTSPGVYAKYTDFTLIGSVLSVERVKIKNYLVAKELDQNHHKTTCIRVSPN